jgi:hypothetical protein
MTGCLQILIRRKGNLYVEPILFLSNESDIPEEGIKRYFCVNGIAVVSCFGDKNGN